jgi:hypothetical protein
MALLQEMPRVYAAARLRLRGAAMKCKNTGKPGRLMLALMCIWVACAAVFFLFVENMLGWFLFFSPGWANGFPFGLSFHTVLSVGMTCQILLMLMTAAAAIAAIVGFICTLLGVEWEYLGRGHRIWLWFAALILCISAGIFTVVYARV